MTTGAALARHRKTADHPPWPTTSTRQMLREWEYGSAVVRKYSPWFPLAEMAAALVREMAEHMARLVTWPARELCAALRRLEANTRWNALERAAGRLATPLTPLEAVVRSRPSTGPPSRAGARVLLALGQGGP